MSLGDTVSLEFARILRVLDLTFRIFLLFDDCIWFTCLVEIRENAKATIKQVMDNSVSLSVPLVVTFD